MPDASQPDAQMTARPTSEKPMVSIEKLRLSYGALEVLKGVDFTVGQGELAFLIGRSGSGKSSMLRCCNRLEEPDGGKIFIADEEVTAPGVNLNKLRRRIGMVFQSFNLYPHLSALGNVTLALRKVLGKSRAEADQIGLAALDRVGLIDKADNHPSALSGGQQQRVAIARALALEPAVMLFDEPTSALDPELVGDVLTVMRELREAGMTMLVVSHEMAFARSAADRVAFMENGVILEEGSAAQIFGDPQHQRTREFVRQIEH